MIYLGIFDKINDFLRDTEKQQELHDKTKEFIENNDEKMQRMFATQLRSKSNNEILAIEKRFDYGSWQHQIIEEEKYRRNI